MNVMIVQDLVLPDFPGCGDDLTVILRKLTPWVAPSPPLAYATRELQHTPTTFTVFFNECPANKRRLILAQMIPGCLSKLVNSTLEYDEVWSSDLLLLLFRIICIF